MTLGPTGRIRYEAQKGNNLEGGGCIQKRLRNADLEYFISYRINLILDSFLLLAFSIMHRKNFYTEAFFFL